MNYDVDSYQKFLSDNNESSENYTIFIDQENGTLSSNESNLTLELDENNEAITVTVSNANSAAGLTLNLSPKSAADFPAIPFALGEPQELFNFTTGLSRVGFKISNAQNSLYLTNRNDLVDSQQFAFKYDLSDNELTTFELLDADEATKNIEFLDDQVVSLGGDEFQTYDYDLTSVDVMDIDHSSALLFTGTASLEDDVYIMGNQNHGDQILKWSLGNATTELETSINAPSKSILMDGAIIDQV